jgi:RND family efflux transporter MFP subunit
MSGLPPVPPAAQRAIRGALAAALAAAASACGTADAAGKNDAGDVAIVPVARVERTSLANDLVLSAEFTPYQEVDVMAKVAGYVKSIRVDIGDRVREGELLATLEVPELQDELTRAQAAYHIAHLSYTRLADVARREPGLVPLEDVDVARSRDLEAHADEERVETMERYTEIRAPFAGVITKRYANTGSMIQAGTASETQAMPLVRLAENDLLRLTLPVPVAAVAAVYVGQPLDITVVTLGRTIRGKVTRLADDIDMSTRTMDTQVDVPNPDGRLVPGMYAEADLQIVSSPDALSVPLDAVDGLGTSTPHIDVVGPGNVIHIVPVEIGVQTPLRVEVHSGVREGQVVVVGRHTGLAEGEKVDPRTALYDADATNAR